MQKKSRAKLHRALHGLSRQRLENKVLLRLLDRYTNRNPAARYDRALVLISGAFIEQGLESAIKIGTVREYDALDLHADLFGGDKPGAINGFYGKIILGHALGLYTDAFKDDLDRIRHIRNAFAHATEEISFKTQEVSEVCDFNVTEYFETTGETKMTFKDARDRYVFMVFFAVVTFDLIVKDAGAESRPGSYEPDRILP
jgi:hypothetical protein